MGEDKEETQNEYWDIYPTHIYIPSDYWKKRIEHKEYNLIKFRNGYAKNAPTMLVEYKGWDVNEDGDYELYLGNIIEVNNYE